MARCTGVVLMLVGLVAVLVTQRCSAASIVRSDNSPICNSILPRCQAKCPNGQDFMYVCSAGNGPNGGPYILCQCVAPALPVGPPQQAARFVLDQWPGSRACNDKTWLNDCTSQMTATVNGTSVLFTPAVGSAFNEQCDPAPGVVIGPKGTQAAVTFPQYPIAITSTGPDGSLMLDFSVTAGDDPNQMDWSQCIVSYKIIQGSFLNPQLALAGQQSNARIPGLQGAVATSGAHGRTSSAAVAAGVALATALLVTV